MTYTVTLKGKRRFKRTPGLTLRQRLALRILGRAYIGQESRPGWKGAFPFYAFVCPTHGLVSNYPMGYEKRLLCPECLADTLND